MSNERAEGDVVTALQSFLVECPNFSCSKNDFDWKKFFASESEFFRFLKKWSSVFGSENGSVWLQGMSVREDASGKKDQDYLDLSMDFDSGDDEEQFESEALKKPISKSVDEESSSRKQSSKRSSSQGAAKYVPPKINVKMPQPVKAPPVQKLEEEKKKAPSKSNQQQPTSHHQQQQQQYYQAQINQASAQRVPQVAPPNYMHNLDKQPMTNREKFMSYKVQRLETKLEKTSAQLQKFRTGYQNLVNQLTCPVCMEPSARMSENKCCASLCCERCALLKKECPSCHNPTQWSFSPVVSKIASTLKADCPFGCGEECNYSDLEKHKAESCLSALVSCPHMLCSIKVRRRHLEKHLTEECAFRTDNCDPSRCAVCASRSGLPIPSASPTPKDEPKGKEEQRLSQEALPRPQTFQERRVNEAEANRSQVPTFDPSRSAASSPSLPDTCNIM